MAQRGEFTPFMARLMSNFLGREASRVELRLIPYVAYCAQNSGRLDPAKVNQEERDVLRLWKDAGHFEGGAGGIGVTREFWDFMSDVIWWAYACHDEQPALEASGDTA